MGTSVREKSKLSRGLRQAAGARRLRARAGPAIQTVEQERRPLGFWHGAYTTLQREPLEHVPEAAIELWALGW